MTAALMPFTYEGAQLRTVVVDGEPEFVAADVCRILDHSNPSAAVSGLDDDERGLRNVETPSGVQQMVTVTEAGLYSLIIRSRKSEAKTFRRWITHEVLPAIRKTGRYSATPAFDPTTLTRREILTMALEAEERAEVAEAKVAELGPKADLADQYLIAQGGARLVREVAKTLGVREGVLRRFLVDEKLIYARHAPCGDVQYDHYAEFAHHFHPRETIVNHTWGTCSHYTLYILPRGVDLIRKRMATAGMPAGPS